MRAQRFDGTAIRIAQQPELSDGHEVLTGERMFDGKNDVEIFKNIRACQIPPIADLRPDIPSSLAAVLDVALSADPTARFASATAFAHALSQVMKQAIGVDPQSALGEAVRELRAGGSLATAASGPRHSIRTAPSKRFRPATTTIRSS